MSSIVRKSNADCIEAAALKDTLSSGILTTVNFNFLFRPHGTIDRLAALQGKPEPVMRQATHLASPLR